MKKRICYGMGMMLFMPMLAMDVSLEKVEAVDLILAKLRRDEQEYLRLKYVSLVKAYAVEASEALRVYIIELYDSADKAEQKKYDGILQDKLKKGIEVVRHEVAPIIEGESFAHDTNRWLEKIRVDALVRMIQNYSEDKDAEILRIYTRLTCHDYKKRAQEHLERLHRSNPALHKLISLMETNNPSASAILEEIRRLKVERNDPLNGASFLVSTLLGLTEKDLETKRLGGSLGYSSPALQKASSAQVFVNPKERGRGGIVFNLQEAGYSRLILTQFEQGRGASPADAIAVPFTRDELQKIRDYIKLIIGGIEGFDYEVLDQLSLEELATVMRLASDLQIDVLLDLVRRKFVERIKDRDAKYFDATYALLQTFDFSPDIQKDLSELFFTSDQQKKLLSLLHSRFKGVSTHATMKPGPLGYLLATERSAAEFWHPASHKQYWRAFEHADHKRMWSKEFDFPVVTAARLQAPFLLVCTEKTAHIIDMISDRCIKTMSVEDYGCSGSFWVCSPSLDQTAIALGCGDAIVFVSVQTGELLSKLERAAAQDCYYFTSDDVESTIFPEQSLLKNAVAVRALTGTKNKICFWDNQGKEISSIEIAETVLGFDPQGQYAIIRLKNGCALLNLLTEDSQEIIQDGTYRKVVFSYDGNVGVFLRDDGMLEIRDTFDWHIKTTIASDASDCFLSSDNQHIITLHANELRMWHYFDDRLGYIHKPMPMMQAYLFSRGTTVLQEDQNSISKIESHLLEGSERGMRALQKLVLEEDVEGDVLVNANSKSLQPIDNAGSAEYLYAQALEHFAALRYKEAFELLNKVISVSKGKIIHADAYFKLGELYRDGNGVEKSAVLAFECFRKAME